MNADKPEHALFDRLPTLARETLEQTSRALAGCALIAARQFAIEPNVLAQKGGPANAELLRAVDELSPKNIRALYYFDLPSIADLGACRRAFAAASGSARKRSRDNGVVDSKCLYVGSSGHMAQRLKEHLGFGAADTYALQLAHWAAELGLTLTLTCATYADGAVPDAIQAMEDALWDELRPIFGRRGTR